MPQTPWNIKRSAHLVFALGWSDFVLKYRGSVLGYLWSFAVPLTKFAVIFFVFRFVLQRNTENYPLYLLLGIILWEYFSHLTNDCIRMPFEKSPIITKVAFPRLLLAFAAAWKNTVILFTHLLIYLAAATVIGGSFSKSAVLFPLAIIHLLLFGLSIGLMLSSFVLKFRDIQHLWDIVLQVLFWITPVFYKIEDRFSGAGATGSELLNKILIIIHKAVYFQPLTLFFSNARETLLYGSYPSLAYTFTMTAAVCILFTAAVYVFKKRSTLFLEQY